MAEPNDPATGCSSPLPCAAASASPPSSVSLATRGAAQAYQVAAGMHDESGLTVRPSDGRWRSPRPSPSVEKPQPGPVSGLATEAIKEEITIRLDRSYSQRMPDGTLAAVFDKGLSVTIRRGPGKVTQLLADRGVVFTTIKQMQVTDQESPDIQNAVDSVYLEGDVRVIFTAEQTSRPDARLEADQVLYEVSTDRAVLTNAVMHTTDPSGRVPIVMRARLMKQLSNESDRSEYRLDESVLTTSSFAIPTYAVAAERTYVRQTDSEEWQGTQTTFSGKNATMDVWGTPILWLPYVGGSVTDREVPAPLHRRGQQRQIRFLHAYDLGPVRIDRSYPAARPRPHLIALTTSPIAARQAASMVSIAANRSPAPRDSPQASMVRSAPTLCSIMAPTI